MLHRGLFRIVEGVDIDYNRFNWFLISSRAARKGNGSQTFKMKFMKRYPSTSPFLQHRLVRRIAPVGGFMKRQNLFANDVGNTIASQVSISSLAT